MARSIDRAYAHLRRFRHLTHLEDAVHKLVTGLAVLAGTAAAALAFTPAALAAPAGTPSAATPAAPPVVRNCAAPSRPHQMACMSLRRTDISTSAVGPHATVGGYGPADLRGAYNLTATGSGAQTVAIVDAQDDPNAEADLATYRSNFGLPACTTANGCFRKVNQSGNASPLPTADAGWAGEISLDVDMVSAICPNCHILLVEASQPTTQDLGTAVNTAIRLGAKFVSNSYGGDEDGTEPSADASFYNHPGIVITASTGDSNTGASYPATGIGVTAVGGTRLVRNSSARGWGETVWKTNASEGTGSGCSASVAKPSFQASVNTGCSRRAEADVSADADPATGVAVFDTFQESGWGVFGGTSASAPMIAAVYALAGNPGSTDSPNAYPYAHTSSLNDVTSGNNGSCSVAVICNAGTGWDGPTGLGTPNGTGAFVPGGGGTPPGGCTAAQLVSNGGFESGNSPWTATSGVLGNTTGESAHAGTHYAWLDGYGTTHTDTLQQSVTIPSGCTTVTLTYWLHVDTAETTTTTQFDKLTVTAGSASATLSNLNKGTGYTQRSLSVTGSAGSTITVKFTGTEDSSLQTSFVVDDVAVNVS
jgi:subtilase family serine protease